MLFLFLSVWLGNKPSALLEHDPRKTQWWVPTRLSVTDFKSSLKRNGVRIGVSKSLLLFLYFYIIIFTVLFCNPNALISVVIVNQESREKINGK